MVMKIGYNQIKKRPNSLGDFVGHFFLLVSVKRKKQSTESIQEPQNNRTSEHSLSLLAAFYIFLTLFSSLDFSYEITDRKHEVRRESRELIFFALNPIQPTKFLDYLTIFSLHFQENMLKTVLTFRRPLMSRRRLSTIP